MATNITARLSSLRKEKGLSQKEAAAGLGVSQALLSHYENGIRECGLDFLCRAPAKMPMSFRTVIDRTQSFVESRCEKSGIKLDGGYTTKF